MAAVQNSLGLHVLGNFTTLSFWMFCGYCSFGLVTFNFDLLTIILTNNSFNKLERSHHSHMIPLRQTDRQTDGHSVLCDNTMTKFQTADTEYERNDAGESHIKQTTTSQSDNNVSTWSMRSLDRSQSRNTDCSVLHKQRHSSRLNYFTQPCELWLVWPKHGVSLGRRVTTLTWNTSTSNFNCLRSDTVTTSGFLECVGFHRSESAVDNSSASCFKHVTIYAYIINSPSNKARNCLLHLLGLQLMVISQLTSCTSCL